MPTVHVTAKKRDPGHGIINDAVTPKTGTGGAGGCGGWKPPGRVSGMFSPDRPDS